MDNELPHINNHLTFQPYYHLKYLFVLAVFLVSGICVFSHILVSNIYDKILFLFPLFCAFFASYYLLCFLFIYVKIDDCGIMLENSFLGQYAQFKWSQLNYGYYIYDLKGNKYLLFSPKQLTEKEQKSALRCSLRVIHKLPVNYTSFTCLPVFLNWLMPNLKTDIERIAHNHINFK